MTMCYCQVAAVLKDMDPPRCQLKLLVSGKRGLEVDSTVPPDHPLIEFKGKVMLQQQYLQENDIIKR